MNEIDNSSSVEIDITRGKRYYWIDHARGFIMMLLVITEFLPAFIREAARFFLEHPEPQRTVEYMNFYDVGAPAFIFIMGFLMPLSFFHRKERDGTGKAVRHMIIRYGVILLLGYLVILIDQQAIVKTVDGMIIVIWDVLPSLGLVGLIAIPFLFVSPKIRAILASALLIFYQLMLLFGGWREYAIASVHGGILGTIFGFSVIMIYATCLGELFFMDKEKSENKKYQIYALVGIIAFLGGILLTLIPEWYANKRQVTLTYILISLGTSILLSFVFVGIDKVVKKPIFILDSYGKNPFLIYVIAIVLEFLIADIIGLEKDFLIFIIMTVIITLIAVGLDKWGKIIKL
ncbi:MAG: acyltransferase family protein [Candidatus Thorarchaeota archaeon]